MSKTPVQVWALVLAFMGMVLAIFVLFVKVDPTTSQAVVTIANSLVSGAIGAFAGHAAATKGDVTTVNTASTITTQDPK